MIVPAHHFWCYSQLLLNSSTHVAWSAAGILSVVWIPDASDAEIRQVDIAHGIQHKIFRFNVTVNNSVMMDVFQGCNNAGDHEFYI